MATSDAEVQLLEGLNEDLRGEFQAVIMYRLYASMVQGPSPLAKLLKGKLVTPPHG